MGFSIFGEGGRSLSFGKHFLQIYSGISGFAAVACREVWLFQETFFSNLDEVNSSKMQHVLAEAYVVQTVLDLSFHGLQT